MQMKTRQLHLGRSKLNRDQVGKAPQISHLGEPIVPLVRPKERKTVMAETVPAVNPYEIGLEQGPANHAALTPIHFLYRAATTYPDHVAVIYGSERRTYAELLDRCQRLAAAFVAQNIVVGDTVSVIAPNIPQLLECHFAVPMSGAVLNAMNTRLDAATIAFILDHAQTKILISDSSFRDQVEVAVKQLRNPPRIVWIEDTQVSQQADARPSATVRGMDYEEFLATGSADTELSRPVDEWQAISLNYTSGTTGNPKGVVYHHRGAYLNALSGAFATEINHRSVYLWTLPMFHCNGWCFPWAVTAVAGTHVCLRSIDPAHIFDSVVEHEVTAFCGAPIILNMLIHAPAAAQRGFDHNCSVFTGGAAPPSVVIAGMEELGFSVTQLYGLTECYGPCLVCPPQADWSELPLKERAGLMARQGLGYPLLESIMVADPTTCAPVPCDGETIGEIMLRGNTVMKGYLKNPEATAAAFQGGWFHTGDLAVAHPDGYIEVKDRSKDIIISGGENISSLEIEEVLYQHPDIMEAAVVARPDGKWGESPCAFVDLGPSADRISQADVIAYCRTRMAAFKIPRTVVFGPLPKTSTGKIQKFDLRQRAAALNENEG